MHRIATLALGALLSCQLVPAFGCDALPAITAVASVIDLITGKVDKIKDHVRAMSDDGLVPSDIADKVAAVTAILDKLDAAAQASPAVYEQLVAQLGPLWEQLLSATNRYGVRAGSPQQRLGATPRGSLVTLGAGDVQALLRGEDLQ